MKTIDAYCSACDQSVRLVLTDEPVQDDASPIHDREVVCLEIGEHSDLFQNRNREVLRFVNDQNRIFASGK